MDSKQHAALVNSLRNDLSKFLGQHMDEAAVSQAMELAARMTERAFNDGAEFGAVRERTAAQLRAQQI